VTKIQRTGSKSFLVFADIDFFKKINDEFGHSDGDDVLIEVVSIFKEVVRNSDTVSRWGGEEFLILLADTNISNANKVIERIRIAIESSKIKTSKGMEINLTCSFGFSELTIDYEETIKRSDDALYEAKESGRNRIVYRTT
jgi:diguanylate cyclase (GGDEF)-like protein